jgi:drug/metabolite transporter (DMT)-like permease
MSNTTQGLTRAHLGMLLWALFVGLSFPAVGLMSEGLPPLLLTAIRFAIGALVIWPMVWRTPGRWPSFSGLALYAFMGLCLAGFFGTMFWAAHRVTALSMATLFISAYRCWPIAWAEGSAWSGVPVSCWESWHWERLVLWA